MVNKKRDETSVSPNKKKGAVVHRGRGRPAKAKLELGLDKQEALEGLSKKEVIERIKAFDELKLMSQDQEMNRMVANMRSVHRMQVEKANFVSMMRELQERAAPGPQRRVVIDLTKPV
jgi:hypothetical protein